MSPALTRNFGNSQKRNQAGIYAAIVNYSRKKTQHEWRTRSAELGLILVLIQVEGIRLTLFHVIDALTPVRRASGPTWIQAMFRCVLSRFRECMQLKSTHMLQFSPDPTGEINSALYSQIPLLPGRCLETHRQY